MALRSKIAVIGYSRVSEMFRTITLPQDLRSQVEIEVFDALLEEAGVLAKGLEERGAVDVFVSGSANARVIRKMVLSPVVGISIGGLDLLRGIKEGSKLGGIVAVVVYKEPVPGLADVLDLIKADVVEVVYSSVGDLEGKIRDLMAQGCKSVVGASLACEIAEKMGLAPVLVYSQESLIESIRTAHEIAIARRREIEKAERLRAILNFAYGGIVATDREGRITLFNRSAERILGIPAGKAIGRLASEVIENTRIMEVLASGRPELNRVQEIGDVRIVTNRVPIEARGEIVGVVATFQDVASIQRATDEARRSLYKKGFVAKTTLADVVCDSDVMKRIVDRAERYAHSSHTVLITGESGVGKEMFAQGIHNASGRSTGPFVAVNCAALPESLLESELFGYEEGSFTGARKGGKEGLFEIAHRGTIFLDEVGELSPALQARLLRVIQEREVMRVGGTYVIPVDVRIIASTNRDLAVDVAHGRFRQDLYYRLNVLRLNIPPLRNRLEDIPALVSRFFERRSGANMELMSGPHLSALTRVLMKHTWPGNVRELENCLDSLLVLLEGKAPTPAELASVAEQVLTENLITGEARNGIDAATHSKAVFERWRDSTGGSCHDEMSCIEEALRKAGGRVSRAADLLGISRTTLWRRMRRLSRSVQRE